MPSIIQTLKTRIRASRILHLMSQARKLSDRKEYERAYTLYRAAAELGCVRAVCIMGMMSYRGFGVTKNEQMAFLLISYAAGNNDGEAQYFLGEFYRRGVGTKVNAKQAVYWFQESAINTQLHDSTLPAQYELACLLLRGEGVPPNEEMAMYWFTEAANDGYKPAKKFLEGGCQLG